MQFQQIGQPRHIWQSNQIGGAKKSRIDINVLKIMLFHHSSTSSDNLFWVMHKNLKIRIWKVFFDLQKGITSLKNLKNLQDLKLRTKGITFEILLRGLTCASRSTQIRLCLWGSIFEEKELEHLIESAPNLNHICVANRVELKVINTN